MHVIARRSLSATIASLCALIAVLAVFSADASAAAPEKPETASPASEITNTAAVLKGTVNPAASMPASTSWYFDYAAGSSCTGPEKQKTPVQGPSEAQDENTEATIVELQPHTEYTFCLVARNEAEQVTLGNEVSFTTTAAAPEAPTTQAASEVTNTTALLDGVLNPNATSSAGWHFAYRAGTSGCAGGASTPAQPEAELRHEEVKAELTGLQAGQTYTACLVASNAVGETAGAPVTFTTSTAPVAVTDQFASGVGITSATLSATLNSHGSATTYYFEYGTTEAYGSATSRQELAAAPGAVSATAQLAGLAPYTTYDARVVAENGFGTVTGAAFSFTTFSTSAATVLDGRVYEMVTPLQNDDADIYAPYSSFTSFGEKGKDIGSTVPFQAAENGESVTYVGDPVEGGNGSGGASIRPGNQFLARRSASGWTQEVLAATGHSHSFYEAFSPELSVGILHAGNGYGETTALLPEAEALNGGYHVLYARDNDARAAHALFTQFAQPEPPGPYEFMSQFVGGSHDFSTMVFDANAALISDAPAGSDDVYESVGGQLSLVNVLEDGTIEPDAQAGGVEEVGGGGEGSPEFSHAVSADGSRVFWTGLGSHPNLYMREGGTKTVQLDASQAGGSGGGGHFWTASNNGERVFFTDDASAGLTSNTVSGSGSNLYEYDVAEGKLTDLTPGADARVQGVIGASEDGGYVYFVANGVLASGASAGGCVVEHGAVTAMCNLYLRHAGGTTFIRQLSDDDGMATGGYFDCCGGELHGDWREGLGHRTAQVSPDGALVFDSVLPLTGYRNEGTEEVYLYSPSVRSGEGELVCASCDPSGAPARGEIGGFLPLGNNPAEALRVVSADGTRVFFDSADALVPQDSNGLLDVYEWEREGSGTCELPSDCLSLLSGGKALSDSYMIGTSVTGNDVFIVTRAQLVGADRNENYDVYDARVEGTRQPAPPSCSGTGCQGVPPAPAIFATPSSVTFEGVGNFPPASKAAATPKRLTRSQLLTKALRACTRQREKKRTACKQRARRRYGSSPKDTRAKKQTKRSAKGGK
jgi:hypothetical protein